MKQALDIRKLTLIGGILGTQRHTCMKLPKDNCNFQFSLLIEEAGLLNATLLLYNYPFPNV